MLQAGLTERQADKWIEVRSKIAPERLLEKIFQKKIWAVLLEEEGYPEILTGLYNPPAVLYGRGSFPYSRPAVAVVGARRATPYGIKVAEEMGRGLAAAGVVVVSGMARGIDSAAHRGALRGEGGTVAVLGCGVDMAYPRENRKLMEEIVDRGAVVSEFPPGTPPRPAHFPMRNRIISGLSQAVVVVEAAERSGAFITVDFALEQGREVFAVPGPVHSPLSRGCHQLLRQGAGLVEGPADVLAEMGWEEERERKTEEKERKACGEGGEARILACLGYDPIPADEIVARTGLPLPTVQTVLTLLELQGLIKVWPGSRYSLS